MPEIRRQATLFLRNAEAVEDIRTKFNPKQAELISAHVTLCREDEVADWDLLTARLESYTRRITLEFGAPVRESGLVFLPGIDADGSFKAIRQYLLAPKPARDPGPHVTLIHPRNGFCTDETWEALRFAVKPFTYSFSEISLILQKDGGIWQTIQNFPLK